MFTDIAVRRDSFMDIPSGIVAFFFTNTAGLTRNWDERLERMRLTLGQRYSACLGSCALALGQSE